MPALRISSLSHHSSASSGRRAGRVRLRFVIAAPDRAEHSECVGRTFDGSTGDPPMNLGTISSKTYAVGPRLAW